jgi:hypothetical protein
MLYCHFSRSHFSVFVISFALFSFFYFSNFNLLFVLAVGYTAFLLRFCNSSFYCLFLISHFYKFNEVFFLFLLLFDPAIFVLVNWLLLYPNFLGFLLASSISVG